MPRCLPDADHITGRRGAARWDLPAPRALSSSRARVFAGNPGILNRTPLMASRAPALSSPLNDQHAGGSAMGDLVRDVSEPLALTCTHALVANDDDRCVVLVRTSRARRWVVRRARARSRNALLGRSAATAAAADSCGSRDFEIDTT